MPELLTVDEALGLVLEHARPLQEEEVLLDVALGRVLREPARAAVDLPPFPSSAMDGFAVRAAETPAELPIAFRIAAGAAPPGPLPEGTAAGIATGGTVPAGADAVVPIEVVEDRGEHLFVPESAVVGQHIRPRGGDVSAGAVVVEPGTMLGPVQIGALAASGVAAVTCSARPRVAILATGDARPAGPGQERRDGGRLLLDGGADHRLPVVAALLCPWPHLWSSQGLNRPSPARANSTTPVWSAPRRTDFPRSKNLTSYNPNLTREMNAERGSPSYRDPSLSVEERIDDLLARMTLEEKVGQMLQLDANAQGDLEDIVVHRHAGSILHASPERLRRGRELAARPGWASRCSSPRTASTATRSGRARRSSRPSSAWRPPGTPSWSSGCARVTAVEVAATGIHWTFSPVLCIARDLRWGRVSETFGEDPFLIGELGAAMVRGYQGDGLADPTAILACAKHFAGYSETQGGRDASEADICRRKLRSWFLPPFERAAREGCRTFMLGYQSMDGVPITVNGWLLNEVLRASGASPAPSSPTGTTSAGWSGSSRSAPTTPQAAAAAVRAGNDMVMTTPGFFEGAQEAVARGLLDEADIDAGGPPHPHAQVRARALREPAPPGRRPARPRDRLRRARRPQPRGRPPLAGAPAQRRHAADCASRDHARTVAVVGPNADDPQTQLGDWAGASGQVDWMPDGHPREMIETVLDGFRAVRAGRLDASPTPAAPTSLTLVPDPDGGSSPTASPARRVHPCEPDPTLIAEAVAAARAATTSSPSSATTSR